MARTLLDAAGEPEDTVNASSFVLVVMEQASEWPAEAKAPGCVALRQEPYEGPGELLRRVYERLRDIERDGGTIATAVLSCSNDASVKALEGRVPLARALLAAVLHGRGGRLDLVGRASAPDRVRSSLLGLAGTLTESLGGTSASVSARFVEAATKADPSSRRRGGPHRTHDERRSAA